MGRVRSGEARIIKHGANGKTDSELFATQCRVWHARAVFVVEGTMIFARGDGMNRSRRYGIVFFAVAIIFVIVNIHNFLRPITCRDCFFPYGMPFTLYEEGGEGGGAGIVWGGLLADAAIIVVVSALLGRVWQAFATRTSS